MSKRIAGFSRFTAILLTAAMCVGLCRFPILAAESGTAATMSLKKTQGTVSVKNSSGRKMSMRSNMKLYNGYHVVTQKESYAWLELDGSKLAKLDADSEAEVRKNNRELELLLSSGNLYFNVTKPLEADETLNICTSTMVAGIRGTSGWVKVIDETCSRVYILEGHVECCVTDPVTGQTKQTTLHGGEWADFYVYEQTREGDKCDIVRKNYDRETIPGFVQTELAGDVPLCEEIYEDSGIDLRQLTDKEALARLKADEQADEEAAKERPTGGDAESLISKEPVWADEAAGGSGSGNGGSASGGSGSASGGSGSGSGGTPAVKTYTVTFDAQRGSSVSSQTVEAGGKAQKPADPLRTGYSFGGWWTSAVEGIGKEWNFGTDTVSANLTLYARWAINQYTVSYETNGGSATASRKVNYNEEAVRPADPVREGYIFGGWYTSPALTSGTEWDFTTDTVTQDCTLYAKWNTDAYTVTFSSNGGSSVPSQTVEAGGKVSRPADPTRPDHRFVAWYASEDFTAGTEWDFTAGTVTENFTLYAKWSTVAYTVSFVSNGGGSVASQTVDSGEKVTKPASPTRTDYVFGGWYTSEDCAAGTEWDFTEDTVTKDIVLYAKWIYATEELLVSGGVEGIDYTYEDGVLTILSATPMTISNVSPEPSADRIVVGDGVSAKLTLSGVNICTDNSLLRAKRMLLGAGSASGQSAFSVEGGSGTVEVTLAEGTENTLLGGSSGMLNEGSGELRISGGGSLTVRGKSYGIQGADIAVQGSRVHATGSTAGIAATGTVSATGALIIADDGGHTTKDTIQCTAGNYTDSVVFYNNNYGRVYGSAALNCDLSISEPQILTIPDAASLKLSGGSTLTNGGGIVVEGAGSLDSSGGSFENNYWLLDVGKLTIGVKGDMETNSTNPR